MEDARIIVGLLRVSVTAIGYYVQAKKTPDFAKVRYITIVQVKSFFVGRDLQMNCATLTAISIGTMHSTSKMLTLQLSESIFSAFV